MWMWALYALLLAFCPTARAADLGDRPELEVEALFGKPKDPITAAAEKKEEEDAATAERLKALEAAQGQIAARVVVLEWPGSGVGADDGGVQRNVRQRIARPDAKFYPEIDLYQAGRRSPDKSLSPADQPGMVPQENVDQVLLAVQDIETVPWNAMSETDWGITANNLRDMTDLIWFVDRPELREPLFLLYVQIGRAAENMNNPVAPFYQYLGGQLVNYYWYLAGVLAYEDPALMSKLTDQAMYDSVDYYKGMLDGKQLPFMTLAFESAGVWDAKKFAGDYQVFINGKEVLVTSPDSFYKVPAGRIDVYLKRKDGHSISDRVELDSALADKIYFVRDVARKKMGVDFIDQVMKHPNECNPRIDGDIMTGLTIYAKLHPDSEIYIAIPVAGNPNDILLYRWDRENRNLSKVLDESQGYPLRFAAFAGIGMVFSGANAPIETPAEPQPGEVPTPPSPPEITLEPAGLPFAFQLRAHYSRLMILGGVEAGLSISGDPWSDVYNSNGNTTVDDNNEFVFKERKVSTLVWGGLGVVLLKQAALGIGPRGFVRAGVYNVPHMVDISIHGGLTTEPPGMEQKGRVRLLLDVDGFVGVVIPVQQTIREGISPQFGLTASAGTSF